MNANLTDMIQNSEAAVSHAEGMIRNFFLIKFVNQLGFFYLFWFIIAVQSGIIDPIVPQFGDLQRVSDPQIPENDTQRPQPVIEEESVSKSSQPSSVSSSSIFIFIKSFYSGDEDKTVKR